MRRFFAPDSFWNQPIRPEPEIDPQSAPMLSFMSSQDDRGLWINLRQWTIPIYEVDARTPRHRVLRRFCPDGKGLISRSAAYLGPDHPMGLECGFAADAEAGLVPIPEIAVADPQSDSHISLVDWESGWVWEMWAARHRDDGDWETNSGIKYRIDGSGVFNQADFAVHNGESIHPYGPCRAAGVPALAGTIMQEELIGGRIEHRLAFATQAAALQKFVHPPACWTDGGWRNGLPEGAVIQLDPALDVTTLGLSRGAQVVARALQEYGAVCVDVCGGHTLYGQGLYADPLHRDWMGLLGENELVGLNFSHYRVLKMENVVAEGMGPRVHDGLYAGPE